MTSTADFMTLLAALDSMSTPENLAILAIGAAIGILISLLCALPWRDQRNSKNSRAPTIKNAWRSCNHS